MPQNPTVVAASLDDKTLKESIDALVKYVGDSTQKMVTDFNNKISSMEQRIKQLGTPKGSSKSSTATEVKDTQKAAEDLGKALNEAAKASATQLTTQGKITEEIKKQADAIRASKSWKEQGIATVGNNVFYDPERLNSSKSQRQLLGSLEEQILRSKQAQTVEDEKQVNIEQSKVASRAQELAMAQLAISKTKENLEFHERIVEARRKYEAMRQTGGRTSTDTEYLREQVASLLGVQTKEVQITNLQTASYNDLSRELKSLQAAYNLLSKDLIAKGEGADIAARIRLITRAMQDMKQQAARPVNLAEALGHPESTIDQIHYKIQQLRLYLNGLDYTKQRNEIDSVNKEITRLTKVEREVLGANSSLISSNNALARSWNYMKNRLAFYLTAGASTAFVKKLAEVRGQYEMIEKSLGILIGSAERGTRIFQEFSNMALVSPYTLIELSNAARQLTAYGVAARDLVDTTRRLADVSAAVGAPIENIAYALGHVQSYGYLTSLQARQFANNGIPLVKELANMYSELEGRIVSVGDVYARIKKKQVEYADVAAVINRMTDEGGRFFDYQAKMADTLKVRLANLNLAWNNMLNDIGKDSQGLLHGFIGALRTLFQNWKKISHELSSAVWAAGLVVGWRILLNLLGQAAVKMKLVKTEMELATAVGGKFARRLSTIGASLSSLFTNSLTWWSLLAFAVVDVFRKMLNAHEATNKLNEGLRNVGKEGYESLAKFAKEYSDLRKNLYEEGTFEAGATPVAKDISSKEAAKAWESMREEIENSSAASDIFLNRLMSIENVSERLRQGFILLESIQSVDAALKEMEEDTIKVTEDWSEWWNLWAAPDGLVENIKDYTNFLKEGSRYDLFGSLSALPNLQMFSNYTDKTIQSYETLKNNIETTTESINELIAGKGWEADADKVAEVYSKVLQKIATDASLSPEETYQLQLNAEEARSKAIKEALTLQLQDRLAAVKVEADAENKARLQSEVDAMQQELEHFEEYNGKNRVEWERFTKWLKEQHITETTAMFRGMTDEQIKNLNFQEGAYRDWVEKMVGKYSKDHKLAYQDVFNQLKSFVENANKWSIFIKLTIGTDSQKSIVEQLGDADAALKKAKDDIKRLNEEISRLVQEGQKDTERYNEAIAEREAAQADYNKAKAEGGIDRETQKSARARAKARKEAESELQRSLKEELSLIDKVRSVYKNLTKEGVDSRTALATATNGYEETVESINKTLRRFNIKELNLADYAGVSNPRVIMQSLQQQLDALMKSSAVKPAEIKDLQVKLKDLKVDAITFDQNTFIDSLERSVGKIKDEYELGIELDADPELGGAFADMFGINVQALPKTFKDALREVQKELDTSLSGKGYSPFSVLDTDLEKWAKDSGITQDSKLFKALEKIQNEWRDGWKKVVVDAEKVLDDYVNKYGILADRMYEIDKNRLEKLSKLSERYGDDTSSPHYAAAKAAVEQGAAKERDKAIYEEFTNSDLYIAMFEDLDHASTTALDAMKDRLGDVRNSLKNLDPAQLKALAQQMRKIDETLIKRNPWKEAVKTAKQYMQGLSKEEKQKRKIANAELKQLNKNKTEQSAVLDSMMLERDKLVEIYGEESAIVKIKDEAIAKQREAIKETQSLIEQNEKILLDWSNLKSLMSSILAAIGSQAQTLATNLQGIVEFRDALKNIGVNFGVEFDSFVDGLGAASNGISQIISSLQSLNVGGVFAGVTNTIAGLYDGVASLFGGGSAGTKKLDKQIKKSQEAVHDLNFAYQQLERTVERAMGTAEIAARRATIANKEAELAEVERQKQLEESKRSKDRDSEAIKAYEEQIVSLRNEIEDLTDGIAESLLGEDLKSAAEDFVDTWVEAWREGENTMDALKEKANDLVYTLIKKSLASEIVGRLLKPIYTELDRYTQEGSVGGTDLTIEEIRALAETANRAMPNINTALFELYGLLEQSGAIAKSVGGANLSALQQGIQSITEETANAIEAYLNGMSQQVYLQSDLLTQIRDMMAARNADMELGTQAEMLLQLQQSYQVQMAIQGVLEGWSSPDGMSVRVAMV